MEPSSDAGNEPSGALHFHDTTVGDPSISYLNPEFSSDHRYMVWFEAFEDGLADDSRLYGQIWHCAIDPDTGDLIPADGRGFAAFPGTIWTRGNVGRDSEGVYYVGAYATMDGDDEEEGKLVMVRPTGPTTGDVTVLDSNARPQRRSIFPTELANRPFAEQYIWWFENDVGYTPSAADNVSLKWVSVSEPQTEHTVTMQPAPGIRWSPMDTTYARLVKGTPWLTLGIPVAEDIEVASFDLDHPERGLTQLTSDGEHKLDPYSFAWDGGYHFIAGIAGTRDSRMYSAADLTSPFAESRTITPRAPPESQIAAEDQCGPQSHQTFDFAGSLYSAFQISDCGAFGTFLSRPGEIWLARIGEEDPAETWRISRDGDEAKNEPETVVGNDKAWVFYSAYPAGRSPLEVHYQLRRVELSYD